MVIDESHNFRNNTPGRRDEDGNIIRKSRYERLMEDIIKAGVRTKVLLLSATPVNNNLSDLRNQIYFLTEGEDGAFAESLGIASLKDTLDAAQARVHRMGETEPEPRRRRPAGAIELGVFQAARRADHRPLAQAYPALLPRQRR